MGEPASCASKGGQPCVGLRPTLQSIVWHRSVTLHMRGQHSATPAPLTSARKASGEQMTKGKYVCSCSACGELRPSPGLTA